MFDLRQLFTFDPSEGQMPEAWVSQRGIANGHANCIPATVCNMVLQVGGPDIDPQLITDEVFGPDYRGGYGDFAPAIAWIQAHYPDLHLVWTVSAFSFDWAEQAGQAGHLIGIAGYIDAGSVTFVSAANAHGWSHASELAVHEVDDNFTIFNIWTGQMQTYSRAQTATSLYEMVELEVAAKPKPISFTAGGSESSAMMLPHPVQTGRHDFLSIDTEGYVRHSYGPIPGIASADAISVGAPLDGAAAGTLSAYWYETDETPPRLLLVIQVADHSGTPWAKLIDPDAGTLAFDWFSFTGKSTRVQLPSPGPKGDPGPAGPVGATGAPGTVPDLATIASHLQLVAKP